MSQKGNKYRKEPIVTTLQSTTIAEEHASTSTQN